MTISSKIYLPRNFKTRDYQAKVFDAFFNKGFKRFAEIWHRRSGKDKTFLNLMIAASQERVGTYFYCLPELKQAKRVIWKNIDSDGRPFLDHIPASMIKKKHNTEMSIELTNGSIIQMGGADYYDSLMGTNPIGIVYSEYSIMNPLAWDYMRPILAENRGWAAFIFTPRGENHGYRIYQAALKNKNWHVSFLTVDETKRNDGSFVITPEMIETERKAGMREELIQQEFYCKFLHIVGAYFAEQLEKAQTDGRINNFLYDANFPIDTYWDLGVSDSTAIWWIQSKPDGTYEAIWYYENNGKNIKHYVNYLHDIRDRLGIIYGNHYAPHDAKKTDLGSGKTIADFAQEAGIRFHILKKVHRKIDAIEATRNVLYKVKFHSLNCRYGLRCLRNYRKEFNERLGDFNSRPVHDWASHGSDAFMGLGLVDQLKLDYGLAPVYYNRVNTDAI